MENNDTSWIDELYRQRDIKEKAKLGRIVCTTQNYEPSPTEKAQAIAILKKEMRQLKKTLRDKNQRLNRLLKCK